ncbi:MAG: oligogalacturonate lyase family protein [Caldilineaceae bacterium]
MEGAQGLPQQHDERHRRRRPSAPASTKTCRASSKWICCTATSASASTCWPIRSAASCVWLRTAAARTAWEENAWIGHVNTSPTIPNLLTFCHEGPWHEVDNRIWGLNIDSGDTWQIRPRTHPGEKVGHEYWYADGEHLGYHGYSADSSHKFFGRIRYDNTDQLEVSFPTKPDTSTPMTST